MKKTEPAGMRKNYTRDALGKGERGKFYKAAAKGSNLVLLQPEIAAHFRNAADVNAALSALIGASKSMKAVRAKGS